MGVINSYLAAYTLLLAHFFTSILELFHIQNASTRLTFRE